MARARRGESGGREEARARDAEDAILLATLRHVPAQGWTRRALEAGCAEAGVDRAIGLGAFPKGARSLAMYFSAYADRRMLAALQEIDLGALRVRERIAAGVRQRLRLLAPHRDAVRRYLSFISLPSNAPLAARLAYRTVNAIWYAAGDTATDWNFYSKRLLLAGVYGTTLLYWLTDRPDDEGEFPATWAFLERRIDDVMRIPAYRARLGRAIGRCARPLRSAPHDQDRRPSG